MALHYHCYCLNLKTTITDTNRQGDGGSGSAGNKGDNRESQKTQAAQLSD